jgi:hypothetical protein
METASPHKKRKLTLRETPRADAPDHSEEEDDVAIALAKSIEEH